MKIKVFKVNTKFGAPMGRSNKEVSGKCYLQRLPLDRGAYDQGGAYWGFPDNLWVCQDREEHQFFVRANYRSQAKLEILIYNKNVTFYK